MKKWFVMLLCMLLCLPLLAVAEEVQYEWYDDPAGRFSFAYPQTWTLVSKETIEETLDEAEKLDDEAFVSALQSVREQVSMSDMVMLLGEDGSNNINIVPQEVGMEMDGGLLMELTAQLQIMLEEQLPGIVFPLDPYLIELGDDVNALAMEYSYTLAGYEIYGVQTMHTRGTTLYTITLTSDPVNAQKDAQTLGIVLGSLTAN